MLYYFNKILFNNKIQAIFLFLYSLFTIISLITYDSSDPCFNIATKKIPSNLFSYLGATYSDILFQIFGISIFLMPIYLIICSIFIYKYGYYRYFILRIILMICSLILVSVLLSNFKIYSLPFNSGGAVGTLIFDYIVNFFKLLYINLFIIFSLIIIYIKYIYNLANIIGLNNFIKKICNKINFFSKNNKISKLSLKKKSQKIQPSFFDESNNNIEIVNYVEQDITESNNILPRLSKIVNSLLKKSINNKLTQATYSIPPIDLLKISKKQNIKEENANELLDISEKLLDVLNDFGVKGQILNIHCGPVVTSYEFEPVSGTKSSRIIGLADDIARSLSALSTRISIVAGRNVLGIELPNKDRKFFYLRELLETDEYKNDGNILPLVLGKDLVGKAFIVDLAKMPHLLVAGTTGSGKSVAINTMILSLLYRYTPHECRLIMIDPKMLELSIYNNIPHLLTPVVTDPQNAVSALKWAVKEMENRYRLMSNLGVRNIVNYNIKITDAIKTNKPLEHVLQTGFNQDNGKPIYENIPIEMIKLPYIVIIVDEMADLMLVAGKDIEILIQRLAQMARAAGIHIIMATQRPSVDVITGVIKANFPSRISFKVTSKIDSRTILNEQGAEQLLGMGDMLFFGNSSKITRVHGPFIDDTEVEDVVSYLKSTGAPEYISSILENNDDNNKIDISNDDLLYKRALEIVKLERKVSINYIQRCLKIGYNKAATFVEKMEQEGHISKPNHSGKREIFL
jgi:S-DNA-T family DNA segregation ATPase FtsK/SpoIIIE